MHICRFKDENVLNHICIYSLHYRSFCYYHTACILSSGFSTDSAFLVDLLYLPFFTSLKIGTLRVIAQKSLFYHFNDVTILPLWARLWRVDCIHSSRDVNLVWKFIFTSYYVFMLSYYIYIILCFLPSTIRILALLYVLSTVLRISSSNLLHHIIYILTAWKVI